MGEPPGDKPTNPWDRDHGSSPWDQKFSGHGLIDDLTALGLTKLPNSREETMVAWRSVVKSASSSRDMDALKQARDRVLTTIELGVTNDHPDVNLPSDTTCKMCKGTGRIATSFGRPCPSCNGTGHRQ